MKNRMCPHCGKRIEDIEDKPRRQKCHCYNYDCILHSHYQYGVNGKCRICGEKLYCFNKKHQGKAKK